MKKADRYLYIIPFQDKFIVYRPLKPLAFVANRAMVNLALSLAGETGSPADGEQDEASRFLETIGFCEPDPPPPLVSARETPFRPTIAVLFTTTACNFRCVYCYASGGENSVLTLPLKTGQAAIDCAHDNAREKGEDFFSVGFHGGGEPTLPENLFRELLNYCRKKDIPCKISLATNGYWTDRERDWILDHVDSVSLSFDGAENVQNRQRPMAGGGRTYAGVLRTIREMDRRGTSYGIRLTVTDASIDELADSMDFLCRETSCPIFQVEPAFGHGRAMNSGTRLSDNERFAAAFLAAFDIARAFGRHCYYSGARPWAITPVFCQAVDKALIVTPEGRLGSCYEVYSPDHALAGEFFFGRIGQTGKPVVDERVRENLNARISQRRALCTDCFCYWHCAGDCPSKTMGPGEGNHLIFGKRCDLNKSITRELLARYIADAGGVWRGEMREKRILWGE